MFKIAQQLLILFLFLLPWQTRLILDYGQLGNFSDPWQWGAISVYVTDILLFAIIAICFVFCWLKREFKNNFTKTEKLFLYLTIIYFASVLWASDWRLAFQKAVWVGEAATIIMLLRVLKIEIKKENIFLVVGVLIQGVIGAWQFLAQNDFENKWLGKAIHSASDLGVSVVEVDGGRWLRGYGALGHPNVLGGVIVLMVSLSIARFKYLGELLCCGSGARSPRLLVRLTSLLTAPRTSSQVFRPFLIKWLCLIYVILMIFFLFPPLSRAAWVAFVVGIGFELWQGWKGKQIYARQNFVVIFISLAAFLAVFYPFVFSRLDNTGRLSVQSNTERVALASESLDIIRDNWLLGVGGGNYGLAQWENRQGSGDAWDYAPPHNVFLLVWSEAGLAAFVIFCLLLLQALKSVWHAQAGLSVIITLVILMLLDHWLWSLHYGVLMFGVIMGILLNYENNRR